MKNLEQLVAIAQNLPENVRENALNLLERMSEVIEGIGDDRVIGWQPKHLKVVQPTTDRTRLPKGSSIGSMILGEEIQDNPIGVIPLRSFESRIMWSPVKDDDTVLCKSPDGKVGQKGNCRNCPHSVFDESVGRSDCAKQKNLILIKEDLSDIFYVAFSKTNYSFGKDWEDVMKKAGCSPFKRRYKLFTEDSKKAKNVVAVFAERYSDKVDENKVAAEIVPFVEALAKQVGLDREEYLAKFREYLETVASRANAAVGYEDSGEAADVGTTALTFENDASTEDNASAASSAAGKYDL